MTRRSVLSLPFYSLASLFVYQHYVSLAECADKRGGRLEMRVNFNLDEFGNFTKIPNFSTFLTVGAGRGIRYNLYVQSFSQLDEKYGRETAQTIKDNCHAWIYLKTANTETAEMISKRLGNYTCSSFSRSSSYSSGGNKSYNASSSMNLISRPLLTPEEILRIERPFILVMLTGQYPAVMQMPDLSKWLFNRMLGLGDMEHNRRVREAREASRPTHPISAMKLWGIWKAYSKNDEVLEQYMEEIRQERINKL